MLGIQFSHSDILTWFAKAYLLNATIALLVNYWHVYSASISSLA